MSRSISELDIRSLFKYVGTGEKYDNEACCEQKAHACMIVFKFSRRELGILCFLTKRQDTSLNLSVCLGI